LDLALGADDFFKAIKIETASHQQAKTIFELVVSKMTTFARNNNATLDVASNEEDLRTLFTDPEVTAVIDVTRFFKGEEVAAVLMNGNTFVAKDFFKSHLGDCQGGEKTGVLSGKYEALVWGWNKEYSCWILSGDNASLIEGFLKANCILGEMYDEKL
jgi:hypothetical protein